MAGQPDTILLPNRGWTQDEELGAHFDGDKPAMHISDAGAVVTGATLTLTSKMRPTVVVAPGQCIEQAESDDVTTAGGTEGTGAGGAGAPAPEGTTGTLPIGEHPWDLVVSDQCQP